MRTQLVSWPSGVHNRAVPLYAFCVSESVGHLQLPFVAVGDSGMRSSPLDSQRAVGPLDCRGGGWGGGGGGERRGHTPNLI